MSSHSSSPRNKMVYHFTLWPEGGKVLPYLPRSYYLSIKKPIAELQLSKQEHATKGSFLFWEAYSLWELHWQNTAYHTVGSCLCLVDKYMNEYYHTGIQALEVICSEACVRPPPAPKTAWSYTTELPSRWNLACHRNSFSFLEAGGEFRIWAHCSTPPLGKI